MSRTLDYFTDFLDKPEGYDDGQYRIFFDEWLVFLSENEKTVNFLSEEWRERRERLHIHYYKRLFVTPEIEKEFEEINIQLQRTKDLDDDEMISFLQRYADFVAKYQYVYRFTIKDIERAQQAVVKFKQSIKNCLIAEEKLKQSEVALEDSMNNLEEAMVEEYERTGKMPVVNINLPQKKKSDN